MQELLTERLLLRQWQECDVEPLIRMNQDSQVTEFMHGPLTRQESEKRAATYKNHIETHGWGRWAVSIPNQADFIGWIGLCPIIYALPFLSPSLIEVGWRLLPEFWGNGYATEGAKAALKYGFEILKKNEIVSLTIAANIRSQRVLEKLGMHHAPQDTFDHPKVEKGSPLKQQLLYRITKKQWEEITFHNGSL